MSRQRVRAAVVAAVGVVLLAGPGGRLGSRPQRHLPVAPAARRLPRRGGARPSPCRSRSSCIADVRAEPPAPAGPGRVPPALAALRAPGDRPDRLDLDRRPGHRRRPRARATSRRSSCGSTAGSASRWCRRCSTRLALARPVRDDPRHRREGGTGGRDRGLGDGRLSRVARALAGDRRAGLLRLARARRRGQRAADAVHRPRRLHRVHAGDDGPVRPRRLAPRRRDVHRLVRAARTGSRRSGSIGDTDSRRAAGRSRRGCWAAAGRRSTSSIIALGTGSILFDGLSQTQPWFSVFGAPDVPIKTLQLLGFLGLIVGGALIVSASSGRRRRPPGCCRSPSAT